MSLCVASQPLILSTHPATEVVTSASTGCIRWRAQTTLERHLLHREIAKLQILTLVRTASRDHSLCDVINILMYHFISGVVIDLSPLRSANKYTAVDDSGAHTYDFNVCSEVKDSDCTESGVGK